MLILETSLNTLEFILYFLKDSTFCLSVNLKYSNLTFLEQWDESSLSIIGQMVNAARSLAVSEGIADTGYRLLINQKEDAGQMVDHLHLHVYGGEKLRSM